MERQSSSSQEHILYSFLSVLLFILEEFGCSYSASWCWMYIFVCILEEHLVNFLNWYKSRITFCWRSTNFCFSLLGHTIIASFRFLLLPMYNCTAIGCFQFCPKKKKRNLELNDTVRHVETQLSSVYTG